MQSVDNSSGKSFHCGELPKYSTEIMEVIIMEKRCVVTGLGMINAIGNTVEESWNNCINGVSGIKEVKSIDTSACYAHLGAESAENFDVDAGEDADKMDRVSLLCVKAAREALADAGIDMSQENPDRVGVIIGSCVGGAISIQKFFTEHETNPESTDAGDIIKMPIGAIASNVAKIAGAKGVVTNVGNACAASTISIEYACDLIRSGVGDVFIVGGSDSFSALAFGGFTALHALDDEPCSPYNKSKGITLGEGAGILIIESYEHAAARQAKVYCDVIGGGISSDAHHITAPRPDSEGQMNAMKWALESAQLKPEDIDYINGHATGTPLNDSTEIQAMQTIFGNNENTSVDSTKSMVGHCLGAAGAVEAIYTVKAMTTNTVPPTTRYSEEDLENLKEKAGKLDFITNVKKEREIDYAMTNNFAFGGNNASVIFAKKESKVKEQADNKVLVTGIGLVSALGNSVEAYKTALKENTDRVEDGSISANVGADDYKNHGIKLAFYRKLDKLSQIQVVSGRSCLKDAGVEVTDDNATDIGIIVGTSDGPATDIIEFHEGLIKHGLQAGSAFIFPNTVYNAAGGYLSINSGIKGINVTVTNGMQAGLQSVCYAYNAVRTGEEKMMLASGVDENTDTMKLLYGKLGYYDNSSSPKPYDMSGKTFVLGEGSTTLMLESEESAKSRAAKVYAEVAGYGMAHEAVSAGTIDGSGAALDRAIIKACEAAGISVDDIDAVVGFGNGNETVDRTEMESYGRVFAREIPVLSVKDYVGEARAAAAALGAAHAALVLSGELENNQNAYIFENGKATQKTVETASYKYVLAASFAPGGSYSAVVLKKAD